MVTCHIKGNSHYLVLLLHKAVWQWDPRQWLCQLSKCDWRKIFHLKSTDSTCFGNEKSLEFFFFSVLMMAYLQFNTTLGWFFFPLQNLCHHLTFFSLYPYKNVNISQR